MLADEKRMAIVRADFQRMCWIALAVCFTAAIVLRLMGQPVWCKCGGWPPWSWDIWSLHNSQHFLDPYTFTHVLHGVVLCSILYWLPASVSQSVRFLTAVLLESSWEILENTPWIIERYRAATISKDYFGDSVANSVADVVACAAGYLIAGRLGGRRSVIFFVVTELILLATVRDCLTLNVLMLLWPFESVKRWQMG